MEDLPPLPAELSKDADDGSTAVEASAPVPITLKEFFEKVPPGKEILVNAALVMMEAKQDSYNVAGPLLELHCDNEMCGGLRGFNKVKSADWIKKDRKVNSVYTTYICRNCGRNKKLYALQVCATQSECRMFKLAETPDFGGPTSSKVISLIREEREHYIKGRRSENLGLGIGAFTYYRRVVENQKDKIFDEVIRASKKINAAPDMIAELERAKKETQFHKAMEAIKPAVPQALLINGQNPLLLLHYAISEGMHAQTDADCLEMATSVRLVLTELVDRMATVLSDHAELNNAVNKLMQVRARKTAPKDGG
jgi:hypothetical protein